MSFLTPTDVLEGIRICRWIYENCFERVGRADARYVQFGKDLGNLQPALNRLLEGFERALHLRDHGPLDSEPLQREARELIGDFNTTLKECRTILSNNKEILRDRSGFVQNVKWGLSTEKQVDELRTRIQFHIQKIQIFMESIRLEQSNTLVNGMQELLVHTRVLRGLSSETSLEQIPAWLDSRFRDALEINPPDSYTDTDNFPLEHGFEALYRHYKQSTVANLQTGDRTMEQYLDLLKAHWILEVLTRGAQFKALRDGSCYLRAVARLRELIADQYAQPGLAMSGEDDLKKLDESAFAIWPVRKLSTPRQLTEPDGLEEKILEVSLPRSPAVRTEDLLVFQRGPTTLRLARNIVPATGPVRQESEKINTHIDRFIPMYAVPSSKSGSPPLTIKLCDGKETGGSVYEFKSERDIFNFQKAVTGFEIVSDVRTVDWSLNRKKMRLASKLLESTGRIQVWYWNPLSSSRIFQAKPQDGGELSSQWHSSASSQGSHNTGSIVAKVVNGENNASVSAIESDGGETVIAVNTPPLPILFIYAKLEGGYGFLHLQLRPGLQIVDTSCRCRKSGETCRRTVIENLQSKTPRPFTVRRLAVSEAQLDLWDLCVFGLPEHPLFKDTKRTEHLKCDYLNLDFPSVADRKRFNNHLRLALRQSDEAQVASKRTITRATYYGDRPDHNPPKQETASPSSIRSPSIFSGNSSWTAISREPALAPLHRPVSISPNFVNSIDTALDSRAAKTPPLSP